MENLHGNVHFCAFMFKICMQSTKTRFHVFLHLVPPFTPPPPPPPFPTLPHYITLVHNLLQRVDSGTVPIHDIVRIIIASLDYIYEVSSLNLSL